jgi:arylsulfatase A-like enzyme
MRWPARLPRGKTVDQPAITMDLTATFLAAAQVAGTLRVPSVSNGTRSVPTTDRQLDGMDLLPILTGERPRQDRTFFWRVNRSNRQQKAIRHGDWKYVNDGGVEVLVNLREDIQERRDLGYRHPDVLADLKARLKAWEAEMDSSPVEFVVR